MNLLKGITSTFIMGIVLILVALGFIIYAMVGETEDDSDATVVETNVNATPDVVIPETVYPEGTYGEVLADEATETADLATVLDDPNAFGTAYRLFAENGDLSHAVTVNLPAPGEGNQYEGWLVVPGESTLISTGVMIEQEDATWLLEFTAGQGYETYSAVVITEETVIDTEPETHVLEGTF